MRERVDRREKRKERFTFFFLLFLVILALYSFLHSAFFTVTEIVVQGNSYFTREEILSFADLSAGRNIFTMDTGASQAALTTHPRVAIATIRKQYPSRLLVEVSERQSVAIISYGGSYLELDKSAYVLGVLGDKQPLELPLIIGSNPSYVRTGAKLEGVAIADATAICEELGEELRHQIDQINIEDPKNIILLTISRVEVWWGSADQLGEKAAVLSTLTGELADKAGRLLDLRSPRSPVLR